MDGSRRAESRLMTASASGNPSATPMMFAAIVSSIVTISPSRSGFSEMALKSKL
jgi:hypothetical protein